MYLFFFFFFKQKTAYEIYQCDWSSDVCSSDLLQIKSEIKEQVSELKAQHSIIPGLAVILAGDNPASAIYVRNKQREIGRASCRERV